MSIEPTGTPAVPDDLPGAMARAGKPGGPPPRNAVPPSDLEGIRADIKETRSELEQTVDELADRLSPKRRADALFDRAILTVRGVTESGDAQQLSFDQVAEIGRRQALVLREKLRGHEVPAAVAAGVGLLLVVWRRRARRGRERRVAVIRYN